MAEEKDKSLDDRIKEAELAKIKAETAEVEKRGKQAKVMGVPIVQIIFGGIVVGFVLLNYIQPLVRLNTDIATKESEKGRIEDWIERIKLDSTNIALKKERTRLDSINKSLNKKAQELEIQADKAQKEIASLNSERSKLQKSISALNGQKKNLLATIDSVKVRVIITAAFGDLDSGRYANALEQYEMIKAKNYYDAQLNPESKGFENKFELQPGDSIIFDAATGLYWQQGGSSLRINYAGAHEYIRKLNDENYGDHNDWRLPTLEEAMSFMQPERTTNGLYIDPAFDNTLPWIWTADRMSASIAWVVFFDDGYCNTNHVNYVIFVRAVRSGQ